MTRAVLEVDPVEVHDRVVMVVRNSSLASSNKETNLSPEDVMQKALSKSDVLEFNVRVKLHSDQDYGMLTHSIGMLVSPGPDIQQPVPNNSAIS